jgi:phosphatidylglycerophosphatase A
MMPAESNARRSRLSPAVFLATGGGIGFAPFAPGTVGTLLGLPLSWAILQIPNAAAQVAVVAAICLASVPICTAAARRLGGAKDPGAIVLDEIASLPIVFLFVPSDRLTYDSWIWAAGFVLFRLFDVTKPPPARQLERLPEGIGIMADDIAAAIYACAALHLLIYLLT